MHRADRLSLITEMISKAKAIKILSLLFISIGLVVILFPPVSNKVGEKIFESRIQEFENSKNKVIDNGKSCKDNPTEDNTVTAIYKIDLDRLYDDSVKYNDSLKTNQREYLKGESSDNGVALNLTDYGIYNGVYGYISAPTINMQLPIYLGASDYNMSQGAAHITYTSLPLGGDSTNTVLAAHSGYIGRLFFDNIIHLSVGDTVSVTTYWDTLNYTVSNCKISKNYESSDCYIEAGKDKLTLITCISDGHGDFNRYYVICDRITAAVE